MSPAATEELIKAGFDPGAPEFSALLGWADTAPQTISGGIEDGLYEALRQTISRGASLDSLEQIRKFAGKKGKELAQGFTKAELNKVGAQLASGLAEGLGPDQIASRLDAVKGLNKQRAGRVDKYRKALEASGKLSPEKVEKKVGKFRERELRKRKRTIARTEANDGVSESKRIQALDRKQNWHAWFSKGDAKVSPKICARNEAAGWIPIDQAFPSGHIRTAGHVECRCTIVYRTEPPGPMQIKRAEEASAKTAKALGVPKINMKLPEIVKGIKDKKDKRPDLTSLIDAEKEAFWEHKKAQQQWGKGTLFEKEALKKLKEAKKALKEGMDLPPTTILPKPKPKPKPKPELDQKSVDALKKKSDAALAKYHKLRDKHGAMDPKTLDASHKFHEKFDKYMDEKNKLKQKLTGKPPAPSLKTPKELLSDEAKRLKLTDAEADALFKYTGDDVAFEINKGLREGIPLKGEAKKVADNLDKALEKIPKYKGKSERSLGFNSKSDFEAFKRAQAVGSDVKYDEFLSTSRLGADTFDDPPDFKVLMKIDGESGRDVTKLSQWPEETEILFPRGSKFKVVSSEGKGTLSDPYVMHLSEIEKKLKPKLKVEPKIVPKLKLKLKPKLKVEPKPKPKPKTVPKLKEETRKLKEETKKLKEKTKEIAPKPGVVSGRGAKKAKNADEALSGILDAAKKSKADKATYDKLSKEYGEAFGNVGTVRAKYGHLSPEYAAAEDAARASFRARNEFTQTAKGAKEKMKEDFIYVNSDRVSKLKTKMGSGAPVGAKGKLNKAVDEFNRLVDKDVLDATNHMELDVLVSKGRIRASYNDEAGRIKVSKSDQVPIWLHEFGHSLDGRGTLINKRAKEWRKKRALASGETMVKQHKGMAKGELGYKNKFIDIYIGRYYKTGASEIVSMGLQFMTADPGKFALKDPDMFKFIWDILHGL